MKHRKNTSEVLQKIHEARGLTPIDENIKVDYVVQLEKNSLMLLLQTPIEDLDISKSTYRFLKRGNIHTFDDLITHTPEELSTIRLYDDRILKELSELVAGKGCYLGIK